MTGPGDSRRTMMAVISSKGHEIRIAAAATAKSRQRLDVETLQGLGPTAAEVGSSSLVSTRERCVLGALLSKIASGHSGFECGWEEASVVSMRVIDPLYRFLQRIERTAFVLLTALLRTSAVGSTTSFVYPSPTFRNNPREVWLRFRIRGSRFRCGRILRTTLAPRHCCGKPTPMCTVLSTQDNSIFHDCETIDPVSMEIPLSKRRLAG